MTVPASRSTHPAASKLFQAAVTNNIFRESSGIYGRKRERMAQNFEATTKLTASGDVADVREVFRAKETLMHVSIDKSNNSRVIHRGLLSIFLRLWDKPRVCSSVCEFSLVPTHFYHPVCSHVLVFTTIMRG